jgi:catechol 2,3-dioxygenase-like lactoylglutathione lyase family enzyme
VGPFADPDSNWMATQLEVHPRASCVVSHLRLGPNTNVELFAWDAPDARIDPPRASDVGAAHLAFYVDDMGAAAAYLEAHGARFLGKPQHIEDGPSAGYRWWVFHTPWGLPLELVHRPERLPYEEATSARFYGPAPAWDHAGSPS